MKILGLGSSEMLVIASIAALWLLNAIVTSVIASRKGHGPIAFFVLALFTGPIALILSLLVANKNRR